MSGRSTRRRVRPSTLLVGGVTALAVAVVVVPFLQATPLRPVLGMLLVGLLPGYGLLTAVGPRGRAGDGESDATVRMDGIERLALAVVLSIVLSAVVALGIVLASLAFTATTVSLALAGLTLGFLVIGEVRTTASDSSEARWGDWWGRQDWATTSSESRASRWVTGLLVVVLVAALVTVAVPVVVPSTGEQYTSLGLQTRTTDGERVATGYPTNISTGTGAELVVTVGNHEHRVVEYTVVVLVQNVTASGTVREEARLATFSQRVASGETWHTTHELDPTMTGRQLRVRYLLYKGSVPSEPSVQTADREVHLWVTVTD